MTHRDPTLLEQCNALAADCIPWRMVLPDGADRKRVAGRIGSAWYLMPEGSWSARQFRADVADGTLTPIDLGGTS